MLAKKLTYSKHLPLWVLCGTLLGIITGILFGDQASVLKPIGSTYVKLMQIVVFPYIICSLLHALGSLAPKTALRLFRCSWFIYLFLWAVTLLTIFILSLAITQAPTPSYLNATIVQNKDALLDLLIPVNPFFDLVNNNIPAIVIFSIIYGIAIQKIDKKETFLDVLNLIKQASVTIWEWVVMLAPFAVFALFADSFGTLDLETLTSLSTYLLTMLAGTLILAFWILPAIISAMCPIKTQEILLDLRSAFVISVVTSLSVAALPFIQKAAERLANQVKIEDDNSSEIISTTLAVSYPLAQIGNFFIWLFVLFAAFYYRAPISLDDQLILPFVSLLSSFGSPSTSIDAVTFLAEWLTFPTEASALYVEMMTLTRYGQVLVSVMGFAFITFLVTLRYYGKLKFNIKRGALALLISVSVLSLVTIGIRAFENRYDSSKPPTYLTFELSKEATNGVKAIIESPTDAERRPDNPYAKTLSRIQKSGVIRVGFNSDIIPFSYRNDRNELVGFDIAYAYQLARDLGVKLTFVPFTWGNLEDDLKNHRFDIAASGIYVTNSRLRSLDFSQPYYQSAVALIVKAENAEEFFDRTEIEKRDRLTIGIFDDPVLKEMAARLFPEATIKVLPNYGDLPKHPEIDAAIWTLEQARAWAAQNEDYTAVLPRNLGGKIPIAYLLPPDSGDFRNYLDYWLRLQSLSDFGKRMHQKWINGKPAQEKSPRPGLIRKIFKADK
ncbi:cation:dicarboxylase symporter family transporter [Sneathiella marina]|uniref:Cation:dicarboxylase symporter family transporter n=1 Tax=Sneathiella marina TaxID=2950108 RepID=A0ABY4VZ12_9PROT|nr:cation:dicarboxylase symporter family transporter [Sneathiella marina]USG60170.1 cation:dicarboxylase symporter family transporter [Sneathiella marina]